MSSPMSKSVPVINYSLLVLQDKTMFHAFCNYQKRGKKLRKKIEHLFSHCKTLLIICRAVFYSEIFRNLKTINFTIDTELLCWYMGIERNNKRKNLTCFGERENFLAYLKEKGMICKHQGAY